MKLFAAFFLVCIMGMTAMAQPSSTKVVQRSASLSELTIRDSAGTVYPTNIAQALLMSGKYSIRILPGTNEGVIYMKSEAEISRFEFNAPKPKESNFFKEGAVMPAFKERDMNGNKWNLKDLAGKVVVLNFWFINCPPCRKEIPDLNDVVDKYKDNKEVVFIAVALDQKYEILDFLKTSPYKYNIIDNGRYMAQNYNINLYPTHVVIDRQGKILFHTSGLASGTVPWIKKSIEAGLNNTTPK